MIRIEVNTDEISARLRLIHGRQIPFAASQALNRTAQDVQKAERKELHDNFTLRRVSWAERNIKIGRTDWATKTRLRSIVRVESPGGGSRSDILGKFEEGGRKRPRSGERIAIPSEVKRLKSGVISKRRRPKSFNFKAHGGKVFSTRSNVMKGDQRTFMIRRPGGKGAIFQRYGRRGSSQVRMLYSFAPSVPIAPDLNFEKTARRTIDQRYRRNFEQALDHAIATAR